MEAVGFTEDYIKATREVPAGHIPLWDIGGTAYFSANLTGPRWSFLAVFPPPDFR